MDRTSIMCAPVCTSRAFSCRPAAAAAFFIIIPSVEGQQQLYPGNSIRLCCPSQLCMYILRSFSSWELEWQSGKREGGRKKKKMEEIDTYVYMLFLDYIYKVYTYSTYRNKVEHSCSSIGEKEGRRRKKIGGEMSI